jgi:hypothetical protein
VMDKLDREPSKFRNLFSSSKWCSWGSILL